MNEVDFLNADFVLVDESAQIGRITGYRNDVLFPGLPETEIDKTITVAPIN